VEHSKEEEDGRLKRVRKFFETKAEADEYAKEQKLKARNLGRVANRIETKLAVEAIELQKKLYPYGRTLTEAVDHYLNYLKRPAESGPLKEWVEEFLEVKKNEGISTRHLQDLRYRLRNFKKDFGDQLVCEVDSAAIEDWLHKLDLKAQSKKNYRTVLFGFFGYCERRKACEFNPVTKTPRIKVRPAARVPIFSPAEFKTMLLLAEGDIRAYLLLGGFAGIREAEIRRLKWEQVLIDRGLIDLTATQTKTATRRLINIEPVLKGWLHEYKLKSGPIAGPDFKRRLATFKDRLKEPDKEQGDTHKPVAWKHNALRHSFGSYHLALYSDAAKTALEMGHTSTDLLFKHYREVVTKDVAEKWFNITVDLAKKDKKKVAKMPKKKQAKKRAKKQAKKAG
jgi:integrase